MFRSTRGTCIWIFVVLWNCPSYVTPLLYKLFTYFNKIRLKAVRRMKLVWSSVLWLTSEVYECVAHSRTFIYISFICCTTSGHSPIHFVLQEVALWLWGSFIQVGVYFSSGNKWQGGLCLLFLYVKSKHELYNSL